MLNLTVFPASFISESQKILATNGLIRGDGRYILTWPSKSESNIHFMFDVKVIVHSPQNAHFNNELTHLVAFPTELQSGFLTAMFAFCETFFDTTGSQSEQMYIFPHGIMLIHWDNIKSAKRFYDADKNNSCARNITDNFDIRYFGDSHHDKMAFIADVKRALKCHSEVLDTPVQLNFHSQ